MAKHTIEVEVTRTEVETREVEFPLYLEQDLMGEYDSRGFVIYRHDIDKTVSVRINEDIYGERVAEIEIDPRPHKVTASDLDGTGRLSHPCNKRRFDEALAEARKMLDEITGGEDALR